MALFSVGGIRTSSLTGAGGPLSVGSSLNLNSNDLTGVGNVNSLPVSSFVTSSTPTPVANRLPTFTGSGQNISSTSSTLSQAGDLSVRSLNTTGDAVVNGNLTIRGDVTFVETNNVIVKDKYIELGAGDLTNTPQVGGIALAQNLVPQTFTLSIPSGAVFSPGSLPSTPPTVGCTFAGSVVPGTIIQIYGTQDNDGLFEVQSCTADLMTIRGVGGEPNAIACTGTNFFSEVATAPTVPMQVNIATMNIDTDNDIYLEQGSVADQMEVLNLLSYGDGVIPADTLILVTIPGFPDRVAHSSAVVEAGTGTVRLPASGGIRFTGASSGTALIGAAADTVSYEIRLPPTQGAAGSIITNDGSGDTTWALPGSLGIGDVVSASSSADNAIVRFDGTTGKRVQSSGSSVNDSGDVDLHSFGTVLLSTNNVGSAFVLRNSPANVGGVDFYAPGGSVYAGSYRFGALNSPSDSTILYQKSAGTVGVSTNTQGSAGVVDTNGGTVVTSLLTNGNNTLNISTGASNLAVNPSATNGAAGGNVTLGRTTQDTSTTPLYVTLGGSRSTAENGGQKLVLYDDGTDRYGLGVSSGRLFSSAPAAAQHSWYLGTTRSMALRAGQLDAPPVVALSYADSDVFLSRQAARTLSITGTNAGTGSVDVVVGDRTPAASAAPQRLSLGGTYSTVEGNGRKLSVYDDGTSDLGLGATQTCLYSAVPAGSHHAWYVSSTRYMDLSSARLYTPALVSLADTGYLLAAAGGGVRVTSDGTVNGTATGELYAGTVATGAISDVANSSPALVISSSSASTAAGKPFSFAGATSGSVSVRAAAVTTSYPVVLPAAQGAANTVLMNDGAGNTSWGTPGTSAMNNVTSADSNNVFAGTMNLHWTVVTDKLRWIGWDGINVAAASNGGIAMFLLSTPAALGGTVGAYPEEACVVTVNNGATIGRVTLGLNAGSGRVSLTFRPNAGGSFQGGQQASISAGSVMLRMS